MSKKQILFYNYAEGGGKPSPRSNRLRRFTLPLLRAQAPPATPACKKIMHSLEINHF